MNHLVESTTGEARDVVVMDERRKPQACFELAGHSSQRIFFDRNGRERLRIGLHTDGTPAMWEEGQEVGVPNCD